MTITTPTDAAETAERILYLEAKPVLSVAETSEVTGLSTMTIRRAVSDGSLPARKIGRRILILQADRKRWLGIDQEVAP